MVKIVSFLWTVLLEQVIVWRPTQIAPPLEKNFQISLAEIQNSIKNFSELPSLERKKVPLYNIITKNELRYLASFPRINEIYTFTSTRLKNIKIESIRHRGPFFKNLFLRYIQARKLDLFRALLLGIFICSPAFYVPYL